MSFEIKLDNADVARAVIINPARNLRGLLSPHRQAFALVSGWEHTIRSVHPPWAEALVRG